MNSKEALEEVTSKHVPLGLHEAIIQEAIANGADSDFDLPAFEEALLELQQTGDINSNTFNGIVEYAPISVLSLPLYITAQENQKRLVDAE